MPGFLPSFLLAFIHPCFSNKKRIRARKKDGHNALPGDGVSLSVLLYHGIVVVAAIALHETADTNKSTSQCEIKSHLNLESIIQLHHYDETSCKTLWCYSASLIHISCAQLSKAHG